MHPVIAQPPRFLGQRRIVGYQQPGIAERAQILRREEADSAEFTDRAHRPPAVFGAKGLRRVLDDGQIVPPGYFQNLVQIRRLPEQVHGNYRLGARRDAALDSGRIQIEALGARIHEHRNRAHPRHATGGGEERERRADHFVAGPYAERHQGNQNCVGARGYANAETGTGHRGGRGFEPLHLGAENELAGTQYALESRG